MQKILLAILMTISIILGVNTVYADDDIPAWVKGVAGFWAEDKITDKEFIEALEFLIESDIIQTNDPRVLSLENEVLKLENKIKLFESENTSQSNSDIVESQEKVSINVNETVIKGNVKVLLSTVDITTSKTVINLEITNLENDITPDSLQTDILNVIIQDGKQYRKISDTVDMFIAPTVSVSGSVITESIDVKPFTISFRVIDHSAGEGHNFVFDVKPITESTPMNTKSDSDVAYLITDKSTYKLGDTIIVSGMFELEQPKKLSGRGDMVDEVSISINYRDGTSSQTYDYENRVLKCTRHLEINERVPEFNFEPDVFYDWSTVIDKSPEKCSIDKNGKFKVSFVINDFLFAISI